MAGTEYSHWLLDMVSAARDMQDDTGHYVGALASLLYKADPRIKGYIDKIDSYLAIDKPSKAEEQGAGYTMEAIMYLAFDRLLGRDSIESYSSPGAQYDLVVNGSNEMWMLLCKSLRIDVGRRGMLVEAKATKGKVSDSQFARLCALIHFNMKSTASLGVFFTISGATGFPEKKEQAVGRKSKLSEAWLRQVTFFLQSGTPIIVLDWEDVRSLCENGSLFRIMQEKIRGIEAMTGKDISPCDWVLVDLPSHLAPLCDMSQKDAIAVPVPSPSEVRPNAPSQIPPSQPSD